MNATVSSRVLGRRLRAMRERAKLTGRYVAAVMEYSEAKLSRQEHGTHSISMPELSHLVTHIYNRVVTADGTVEVKPPEVTAEELAELEGLRQRSTQGHAWWMEYEGDLPLHLKTYIELEQEASRIFTFGGEVIHGLLQTPEYARTQSLNFGADREAIERTVWLRSQRRTLVLDSPNPPELDVILTEGALRRCIGSGLREQLTSLVEDSERPNVTLRILRDSMGVHGVAGIYVVMEFPDRWLDPVMHLEYVGGSIIVEEKRAVDLALSRHRSLAAPLDPDDSRRLLKELIATNRSDGIGVA